MPRRLIAQDDREPRREEQFAGTIFEAPAPELDGRVHKMARANDPASSKQAAVKSLADNSEQRAEIRRALQYAWGMGMTAQEIADFLNRDHATTKWTNVTVSRRIGEIRDAGDLVSYDGKEHHGVKRQRVDRAGCSVHVFARKFEPVSAEAPPAERKSA
jgi:hypothetical protein